MFTRDPRSLRTFARTRLGVSDQAVRKAMRRGVFSAAAIRRDAAGVPSVVNADLAVTEWCASGRQLRTVWTPTGQMWTAIPGGTTADVCTDGLEISVFAGAVWLARHCGESRRLLVVLTPERTADVLEAITRAAQRAVAARVQPSAQK